MLGEWEEELVVVRKRASMVRIMARILGAREAAKNARVLIGVLKTRRDLNILLRERWYRIPVSQSPKQQFSYVAFYQPSAFGRDKKRIRYYARVVRRETRPRRDLLPGEPWHPRAREPYYRIRVRPVRELPRPIRNVHPRRVTFGFTTLEQLRAADNLLALYGVPDTERMVSGALRRAGIRAVVQRYVTGEGKRYCLDFAVICRQGAIAIECDNAKAHAGPRARMRDRAKDVFLRQRDWTVIRLPESAIVSDIDGCVARVRHVIRALGGVAPHAR